jgi:hypothetical protein
VMRLFQNGCVYRLYLDNTAQAWPNLYISDDYACLGARLDTRRHAA